MKALLTSAAISVLAAVAAVAAWAAITTSGSFWVYDTPNRERFDAVSGYRMPHTSSREARITDGVVEYVGIYRGNEQGYPSTSFEPDGRQRWAVFGDSFTQAQYLGTNWPARAEAASGKQLLNFALNGTGLANWWSILKHEPPSVDGYIFAVYEDDLFRPFIVVNFQDGVYRMGRAPTWDPAGLPKTLAEALPWMGTVGPPHYIMDPAGFDRAIAGKWRPRPWYDRGFKETVKGQSPPPSDEAQHWRRMMIDAIAAMVKGQPAIVLYLPSRQALLGDDDARYKDETRRFADAIGAQFHDTSAFYVGMSPREIAAHFLPDDGHWNQRGSDKLAAYVVALLR